MLAYEEYLAPARPGKVLEALRLSAVAKGWTIAEEHPGRFFCLEGGKSARMEPRKLEVSVEDYRLESKVRLVMWCSGFTLRRYDGKLDLLKALPYECTRLNGGGTGSDAAAAASRRASDAAAPPALEPAPLGSTVKGGERPSWVKRMGFVEFGLVGLSLAAIAFFVVGTSQDLPRWSVAVAVVLAALASMSSGLALDFFARRELKIASRTGMRAQLRRAGFSAVVAVILLIWLWRM